MFDEEKAVEFYHGFNNHEDWRLFAAMQKHLVDAQECIEKVRDNDGGYNQAVNETLQQLVSVVYAFAHSTVNSRSEEVQNMEKFQHELHKLIVGNRNLLKSTPEKEPVLTPMDRDLPESEPE